MSSTLREQLIAAGLATEKKAREIGHQQRQRGRHQGPPAENEDRQRLARQQQAEKAARDEELNRKQQLKAEKKARLAQIRQMVEQHKLPRIESDDRYNFVDDGKIRYILVDAARRALLNNGELAIVRSGGRYEVVPTEIGARIRERNETSVVPLNLKSAETDENDPYKDFAVPDDLTW